MQMERNIIGFQSAHGNRHALYILSTRTARTEWMLDFLVTGIHFQSGRAGSPRRGLSLAGH